MSSRTDMLDEIVLRLDEIDGTPDYNYTCRKVTWKDFAMPESIKHFPVSYVLIDDSMMTGGESGNNQQTDRLPVVVWGYVKAEKQPQLVAENYMADMCKALTLNRTSGSLDLSLADTCAAFLIRGKGISGDLLSPYRTVEILLEVTMRIPIGTI